MVKSDPKAPTDVCMQMVFAALPEEPARPVDSATQRLLIEGVHKLEVFIQSNVKAEAEALYE